MIMWFIDFKDSHSGIVLLGNNKACRIEGHGSVVIKLTSGQENIITHVRYVSELKRNLLSTGMLDKAGYDIRTNNGQIKISKESLTMLKAKLRNGIYVLERSTVLRTVVAKDDISKLWHLRLGHVS